MADGSYLSFDLSTQTLKAMVMRDDLHIVQESVVNFDKDLPEFKTNGGVYQSDLEATSPVQMWVKAIDTILHKLREEKVEFSKIKGISGTGQQHGSVYWKCGAKEVLFSLDSSKSMEIQLKVICFPGLATFFLWNLFRTFEPYPSL